MTTTTTATARAIAGSRLAHIQGLRAIAVLLVVFYHAGFHLPGGFIGVDVFFIISGFVITQMLRREYAEFGRISLKQFYKRRILRLYPALAIMVVVTLVVGIALLSPFGTQGSAAVTGIAATFSVANFVIPFISGGYFQLGADTNAFLHTWSLSVEEQFYLVFPALIAVGIGLGRRRNLKDRVAMTAVIALGAVSFVICLALSFGWEDGTTLAIKAQSLAFYSPISRAWEFAIGAVVAFAWSDIERLPAKLLQALGLVGASTLMIASFMIDATTIFPGVAATLPAMATAALIMSGANRTSIANTLLSRRALIWIGDRSYSWYLWHWPFIVLSTSLLPGRGWVAPAAALISLLPAMASYHYVEGAYRERFNRRTSTGRARLATLKTVGSLVAATALAASTVYVGAKDQWDITASKHMQSQIGPESMDRPLGCVGVTPMSIRAKSKCLLTNSGKRSTVYLIGDSLAGQYSDAVSKAAEETGNEVLLGSSIACPFVNLSMETEGRPLPACQKFVRESLNWLRRQPPGIIIMSMRSDAYLNGTRFTIEGQNGRTKTSEESKVRAYGRGLAQSFGALESAGHTVVFIQPTLRFIYPNGSHWNVESCPLIRIAIDSSSCGLTVERSALEKDRRLALAAFGLVPNAVKPESFDFFKQLCPDSQCSTNEKNYWVQKDASHLSVQASKKLTSSFIALLRSKQATLARTTS